MSAPLRLTAYFRESDRTGGRLLSDVLLERYAVAGVDAAILLRGVEGYGLGHELRTDRLLSLSDNLPLLATAIGDAATIEALAGEAATLVDGGLVTLERLAPVEARSGEVQATFLVGRHARADGAPAHVALVRRLHAAGLSGATVLLGVDGVLRGRRERARLLGRSSNVPLAVVSVGDAATLLELARALPGPLPEALTIVEGATVCKRDGRLLAPPPAVTSPAPGSPALFQKLTVIAPESLTYAGLPLHAHLVRELRRAGARGTTAVRGIWGFSGDHAPHGDSLGRVRRNVPVVTTIVDEPERIARWFALVDAATGRSGLVTCEHVLAALAGAS